LDNMLSLHTFLFLLSVHLLGVSTTEMKKDSPWDESKLLLFIDHRVNNKIIPLLMHSVAVLGDDWPLHVFFSDANKAMYESSPVFMRQVKSGRFRMTPLPKQYDYTISDEYSKFMKQRSTWEILAPAVNILIIQLDSIICSNSPYKPEDFFQYDMVGSPTCYRKDICINGGLSLRNRESIIKVIDRIPMNQGDPREDQWYWQHLGIMSDMNLPDPTVSTNFGTEGIWNPNSFGHHKPWHWEEQDRIKELLTVCPEAVLIQ